MLMSSGSPASTNSVYLGCPRAKEQTVTTLNHKLKSLNPISHKLELPHHGSQNAFSQKAYNRRLSKTVKLEPLGLEYRDYEMFGVLLSMLTSLAPALSAV